MKWDSIAPVIQRQMYDYTEIIPLLQKRSTSRAEKDPDFRFFNKKMDYDKSLRVDEISLNLEERKNEVAKDKDVRLELTNERRKAKGEKPFETYDIMEEDFKKQDEEESSSVNKIDLDDPFLIEAAAILLDAEILNDSKVAKKGKR